MWWVDTTGIPAGCQFLISVVQLSPMKRQVATLYAGHILSACLAEVVEKKPLDPIEYIAHWIYKYRETQKRLQEVSSGKAM